MGPQPQAAGETLVVNATDPGTGIPGGVYAGPTYTVPAAGAVYDGVYSGFNGTGTITHSAGVLTVSQFLSVGDQGGANGIYNLSGSGTINSLETDVGYNLNGVGVFNQTGGIHNVSDNGLNLGVFDAAANGTYNLSGGTLNVTGPTGLGYTGTGVFTQSGGTATLNTLLFVGNGGAGTYNLNVGGTLNVASIALDNSGTGGGTSTFNFNGGTLRPTGSNGATFFPNVLTTANVRNGGALLNTAGFDVTVAQPLVHSAISGDNATDGGLTKSGAGTLTLTGANTYTGLTNVNGGTLLVNGTNSGTGLVTVQNSGTVLGGTGTLAGPVGVTGGGALNPGNNAGAAGSAANVGRLTTGALTLASSAAVVFDLASGASYDQLFANGNIALGGATLTLNVTSSTTAYTIGQVLDLFHNNSGTLSGTFSNFANNGLYTYGADTFRANYTATDFTLTVTAVPEPGTWAGGALLLGAAGLGLHRRLRRA